MFALQRDASRFASPATFTFENEAIAIWVSALVRAAALRHLFAAVLVKIFRILFVVSVYSAIKEFFAFCLIAGASVNISGIIELFQHTIVLRRFW